MEFCGVEVSGSQTAAIIGISLTIASELIGASKYKENGVVQLIMTLVRSLLPPSSHTPVQTEARHTASPGLPNQEPKRRGRPPSKSSSKTRQPKA